MPRSCSYRMEVMAATTSDGSPSVRNYTHRLVEGRAVERHYGKRSRNPARRLMGSLLTMLSGLVAGLELSRVTTLPRAIIDHATAMCAAQDERICRLPTAGGHAPADAALIRLGTTLLQVRSATSLF